MPSQIHLVTLLDAYYQQHADPVMLAKELVARTRTRAYLLLSTAGGGAHKHPSNRSMTTYNPCCHSHAAAVKIFNIGPCVYLPRYVPRLGTLLGIAHTTHNLDRKSYPWMLAYLWKISGHNRSHRNIVVSPEDMLSATSNGWHLS